MLSDFAKAFYRFYLPKLLHKLKYILNSHKIMTWLGAYLVGREQFEQLNSVRQLICDIRSALGSVPGPLILILYISNMNREFQDGVKIEHLPIIQLLYIF